MHLLIPISTHIPIFDWQIIADEHLSRTILQPLASQDVTLGVGGHLYTPGFQFVEASFQTASPRLFASSSGFKSILQAQEEIAGRRWTENARERFLRAPVATARKKKQKNLPREMVSLHTTYFL